MDFCIQRPHTRPAMTEPGYHSRVVEAQIRGEGPLGHLLTAGFAVFGLAGVITDDFEMAIVGTGLAVAIPIGVYFEHRRLRRQASARDEAERIARERRLEELSR